MTVENKQVKLSGRDAEPTTTFKIRTKDASVNLKNIDANLMGYINSLPEEMQKEVLVTSGNDSDTHAKESWHYHNKAVDLRFSRNLYNYMIDDPNRIRYKISLYNPNHGTGKHIHISSIGEEGVRNGATEHTKDVFLNVYSPEAQEYLKDPNNVKFKPIKDRPLSYGTQLYKGATGADSIAGSNSLLQEVAYKSLMGEEHGNEHYHNFLNMYDNVRGLSNLASLENSDYNSILSQNQLLLSKIEELEETKKKENEYNAKQAMENEKKQELAKRQQEFEFIKGLIETTPSLVNEEKKSYGQEVVYNPNLFQITDFQNNFRVD